MASQVRPYIDRVIVVFFMWVFALSAGGSASGAQSHVTVALRYVAHATRPPAHNRNHFVALRCIRILCPNRRRRGLVL